MPAADDPIGVGEVAAHALARAAGVLRAIAREADPGAAAQADALERRADRLATENAAAYGRAVALLSGAEPAHVVPATAMMEAAADHPARIAAAAGDIADLARALAGRAPAGRQVDLVGCGVVAEAMARVGVLLVEANLAVGEDDDRLAAAREAARRAATR